MSFRTISIDVNGFFLTEDQTVLMGKCVCRLRVDKVMEEIETKPLVFGLTYKKIPSAKKRV